MINDGRLSVCTVSYGHASHLELNSKLIERLNRNASERVDWLVAENAPASNANRLKGTERAFSHYPGNVDSSLGASDQHAQALNALLRHVTHRFVLVLDPDFYIVRDDWIEAVTMHMKARRLAFFGAPWHPRYVENYRYFPAVHCMFIDRTRVSLAAVDFRPLQADDRPIQSLVHERPSLLSRITRRLHLDERKRKPWDTGTRIYQRFGADPTIQTECLVPVYRIRQDWLGPNDPLSLKNRLLETVLPDDRCYLPKRTNSYTTSGFAERGFAIPELPPMWEQLFWQNKPFGLHIRRSFASANRDPVRELDTCRHVIAALCARTHPAS